MNYQMFSLLIFVTSTLGLLSGAVAPGGADENQPSAVCRPVATLKGEAWIERQEKKYMITSRSQVCDGDLIYVKPKSKVAINCGKNQIWTVPPGTRSSLRQGCPSVTATGGSGCIGGRFCRAASRGGGR